MSVFKDIKIGAWKAFSADEVKMGATMLGLIVATLFILLVADFWDRLPEIFTRSNPS